MTALEPDKRTGSRLAAARGGRIKLASARVAAGNPVTIWDRRRRRRPLHPLGQMAGCGRLVRGAAARHEGHVEGGAVSTAT